MMGWQGGGFSMPAGTALARIRPDGSAPNDTGMPNLPPWMRQAFLQKQGFGMPQPVQAPPMQGGMPQMPQLPMRPGGALMSPGQMAGMGPQQTMLAQLNAYRPPGMPMYGMQAQQMAMRPGGALNGPPVGNPPPPVPNLNPQVREQIEGIARPGQSGGLNAVRQRGEEGVTTGMMDRLARLLAQGWGS